MSPLNGTNCLSLVYRRGFDAAAILPAYGQSVEGGIYYMNQVYRWWINPDRSGLTYLVGSTADLVTDSRANVTEKSGWVAMDTDIESVTSRVPTDFEGQQFMQLKVTIDQPGSVCSSRKRYLAGRFPEHV